MSEVKTNTTNYVPKRKVFKVCKVNRMNKDLVSETFENANSASPTIRGCRVFFKVIKLSDIRTGFMYVKETCEDSQKVGILREEDNVDSIHPEYGEFATLETLQDLITDGDYQAYIIGRELSCVIVEVTEVVSTKKKNAMKRDEIVEIENNIIKEGILTKEQLEERKEELQQHGIKPDGQLYVGILDKIQRQPKGKEIQKPKTPYRHIGSKKEKSLVYKMLMHIICGHNIILQGPKSVGKNVAWETVAYILNCRIVMLQCNGRMTKSEMFGYTSTDNSIKEKITKKGAEALLSVLTDNNSNFYDEACEFIQNVSLSMSPTLKLSPGPITEAMLYANEGYGSLLILDEMNLSDPNTLSGAINALTDRHTKSIFINDLGEVDISPNLIIGATQNSVGGNYLGTKQQNDATMSRFVCIALESASNILGVLRQVDAEIDEEDYNTLDKLYCEFNKLVQEGVSESCLNIRGFKAAVELISIGVSIQDAVKECVIYTVPNSDDWDVLIEKMDNYCG